MKLFKKEKSYKFTKHELNGMIYSALMWASDGLEMRVGDGDPEPLVMGDPENLTIIIVSALTEGLPSSEDSSASTTS